MYGMPLNDTKLLDKTVNTIVRMKSTDPVFEKEFDAGYTSTKGEANLWYGELTIDCNGDNEAKDSFLRLDGWSKGVAFVNGFNLGRYWPIMGPQVTCRPYVVTKLKSSNNRTM